MTMQTLKATKSFLATGILILFASSAVCQTDWQNWNGINVNASLTNKAGIRVGHTRSYNISEKYKNQFNQTAIQFSYEINKKWDVFGGVQFISPAFKRDVRTRLHVRAAHTMRLSKKVNWTNSLRFETNSKNENRFRQRVAVSSRLGLRKRLGFLNLAPSLSYMLFYNIGGNPIDYYDKSGVIVSNQTPDGFHRSRLTATLNSKINNYLRISVYYMRQQEFNLFVKETRRINIYDPVKLKTLRPFNNFNCIGLTASISLDPFLNN
jgi:hypothetical protein